MKNLILPIKPSEFSDFVEESRIFQQTTDLMKVYLSNWYADNKKDFLQCMGAELTVVLNQYTFYNQSVHFVKNFHFDIPHQDYIHCIIEIEDKKGDSCVSYKAIFDYALNPVDDTLC